MVKNEFIERILYSDLMKKILDKRNIYMSIYSIESYIFEKELLDKEDYITLCNLRDRFNFQLYDDIIVKVQNMIKEIIKKDVFFKTKIYAKPKKIHNSEVIFRYLHSSNIITQIAIASILNAVLYEYKENSVELNELGRIFPNRFYGNIPSSSPEYMFEPWQKKYKEYSMDISKAYTTYAETKEYSHELMIDLENFFPSINPMIVFDFIMEKLNTKFLTDDRLCLAYMLIKLLYIEIEGNIPSDYYCNKSSSDKFVQGIAQGLPQSYLFGNICMLEISNYYNTLFEGDSYFYVDDSVIYTNKYKGKEYTEAIEQYIKDIHQLNNKFIELSKKEYIKKYKEEQFYDYLFNFNKDNKYILKAHNIDTKSSIFDMNDTKFGNPYLNLVGRIASISNFEMKALYNDMEESTLLNRFQIFLTSIIKEIDRVEKLKTEDSNEYEHYLKYLNRLKRFMKFRYKLLKMNSEDKTIKEHLEELIKNFYNHNKEVEKELVFDDISEDILLPNLVVLLKENYDNDVYSKAYKFIKDFENKIIINKNIQYPYISNIISNLTCSNNLYKLNFSKYKSLEAKVISNYNKLKIRNLSIRNEILRKLLKEEINTEINFFNSIDKNFLYNYEYVNLGTDELRRQIINSYVSHLCSIEINDSFKINRKDSRNLTYNEVRLLLFIRNKRFSIIDFKRFIPELYKTDYLNTYIDYNIFEVIDYFKTYLKKPKYIDDAILVHKYTSEIWKNGSKFLHFYTLHNHEHGIELIKASTTILKNISYFQIKSVDYYILYIACYLHDISMVVHPDLNKIFVSSKNLDVMKILYDFKKQLNNYCNGLENQDTFIKELLLQFYQRLDTHFEKVVRSNHAKDSEYYIRNNKDLSFLDDQIRDIVADVSVAHCFDVLDIYNIKSNAKNKFISKKYIKILLRLADLLDVADNRISAPILNVNGKYMSDTTFFHWLSHRAISHYNIETKYTNLIDNINIDNKSYLGYKSIEEKIIFTFYLNIKYNISCNQRKCDFCYKEDINDEVHLLLKTRMHENCNGLSCDFLCRWMVEKNSFLFEELSSLKKYLERSSTNSFDTTFQVKFISLDNARLLNNDEYSMLDSYFYHK